MIIINLILIQFIVVFIVDLSGFIPNIKSFVSRLLTKHEFNFSLKPFDCSLCLTFWVGIIFVLVTSQFTIPVLFYICILSFFTPVTNLILINIKDILLSILNKIYDKICR